MQVIHFMRTKGYACGKTKTRGLKNKQGKWCVDPYLFKGFPDLTAFVPEIVFFECKAAGGSQTDEQKEFQAFCEKAGVTYVVVRSLEQVEKLFN